MQFIFQMYKLIFTEIVHMWQAKSTYDVNIGNTLVQYPSAFL